MLLGYLGVVLCGLRGVIVVKFGGGSHRLGARVWICYPLKKSWRPAAVQPNGYPTPATQAPQAAPRVRRALAHGRRHVPGARRSRRCRRISERRRTLRRRGGRRTARTAREPPRARDARRARGVGESTRCKSACVLLVLLLDDYVVPAHLTVGSCRVERSRRPMRSMSISRTGLPTLPLPVPAPVQPHSLLRPLRHASS